MTTLNLWFIIVVIIILILLMILAIINTVYWGKIRSSGCGVSVTASQANLYFWLNLIACFLIALILIWAIIMLFVRPKPNALEIAKNMNVTPPLEIHPIEHTQFTHQITTTQPVVTSMGLPGNVVTQGGVQQLQGETMYV